MCVFSEVEVLYGGPNIFNYEVKAATLHDVYLAIASLLLVMVLVFVMSGFSFWLTYVTIYTILSCFPVAFFVYTKILSESNIIIMEHPVSLCQ